ncbi:MAG: hypothetical protein HDR71_15320 [Lachnospiraceae bacterium]|nr:hypothetical protein [Lachnospiraceae bacterium]
MINLRECTTLQVMPEVLRKDKKIQAASYALQKTAQMLFEKVDRSNVYAGIDILPEEILDLLAEEFRAQYYDTSLPVEDKRKAIKKAMPWFYRAGTVSAVKELTELVWRSSSAQVQEWFEYASDPYLFRILLGTDMSIEEELINAFIDAIWKVKNTRSHLESITFIRRIDNTLYVGAASKNVGHIVITDVWKGEYDMHSNIYHGAAGTRVQKIQIREG